MNLNNKTKSDLVKIISKFKKSDIIDIIQNNQSLIGGDKNSVTINNLKQNMIFQYRKLKNEQIELLCFFFIQGNPQKYCLFYNHLKKKYEYIKLDNGDNSRNLKIIEVSTLNNRKNNNIKNNIHKNREKINTYIRDIFLLYNHENIQIFDTYQKMNNNIIKNKPNEINNTNENRKVYNQNRIDEERRKILKSMKDNPNTSNKTNKPTKKISWSTPINNRE